MDQRFRLSASQRRLRKQSFQPVEGNESVATRIEESRAEMDKSASYQGMRQLNTWWRS